MKAQAVRLSGAILLLSVLPCGRSLVGAGNNLYLSAILALRATDGGQVWHFQTTAGQLGLHRDPPLMLADLEIGGRRRKVIMQAPNDGSFDVVARESGESCHQARHGRDFPGSGPGDSGVRYVAGGGVRPAVTRDPRLPISGSRRDLEAA